MTEFIFVKELLRFTKLRYKCYKIEGLCLFIEPKSKMLLPYPKTKEVIEVFEKYNIDFIDNIETIKDYSFVMVKQLFDDSLIKQNFMMQNVYKKIVNSERKLLDRSYIYLLWLFNLYIGHACRKLNINNEKIYIKYYFTTLIADYFRFLNEGRIFLQRHWKKYFKDVWAYNYFMKFYLVPQFGHNVYYNVYAPTNLYVDEETLKKAISVFRGIWKKYY